MFDWIKNLDPETRGLAAISSKFEQMLEDGRHVFDAAANALLGGTDVEVIREDLFATDRRINQKEQEIRRALVVHGSVHRQFGSSTLLVMMSLVKDAERIGDYGKNIFDLAAINGDRIAEPERKQLIAMKDEISKLLVRSRNIYHSNDEAGARQFLKDSDALQDRCDDALTDLILEDTGRNNAATVLCYRYFKRVISHVGNIVTSLVMPLDKLDFFDEPKERPRKA